MIIAISPQRNGGHRGEFTELSGWNLFLRKLSLIPGPLGLLHGFGRGTIEIRSFRWLRLSKPRKSIPIIKPTKK